jgi:hypothetical protein
VTVVLFSFTIIRRVVNKRRNSSLQVWMLGNLGRATYLNSTEYMWPFSTNQCTERTRISQEVNACSDKIYDGMPPHRGRGAPEIDVFEVMMMHEWEHPVLSASLQVAPGIEDRRPIPGLTPNAVSYFDFIVDTCL